jgi:6-pyruvoyltetrahydropterin/6-carboxytetrahydropterin synthase
MHGHGFEVVLHADQNLGADPMGIDFDRLEERWAPVHQQLNWACLNDIDGLENPTSELLASWIWKRLTAEVPELSWVTVYETATAGCHYNGESYRIWKEQPFEAALILRRAPEGHPYQKLHGHSYLVRLHLSAPLDNVLGWTVDYGDVKELFNPIYNQLDHHLLNDLPDLSDTGPANVLHWIRLQTQTSLPQLDRIDLFETPGCGVVLSWGASAPALPI